MKNLLIATTIAAVALAIIPVGVAADSTLDTVKKRGKVICGVNDNRGELAQDTEAGGYLFARHDPDHVERTPSEGTSEPSTLEQSRRKISQLYRKYNPRMELGGL